MHILLWSENPALDLWRKNSFHAYFVGLIQAGLISYISADSERLYFQVYHNSS